MDSTKKISPCPICQKELVSREHTKAYPFCSHRCQLVDLGKWLDGNYNIEEPGEAE